MTGSILKSTLIFPGRKLKMNIEFLNKAELDKFVEWVNDKGTRNTPGMKEMRRKLKEARKMRKGNK
jgi:hypothetical protein